MSNKNVFIKYLEYFFIIITTLQCNSIYLYATPLHISRGLLSIVWQILLILLLLIVFHQNVMYNNKLSIIILIFIFYGIIVILYNIFFFPSFNKAYVIKIIIDPILLTILFCSFGHIENVDSLFKKFENIIVFLSVLSLIFWIFMLLHFPTNFSVFSKWGASQIDRGYFGLSFFSPFAKIKFLGINWIRNSGIFTEPSMFSYVLIIALLIELFIREHKKIFNKDIIILLVTIISTASTTGILVAIPAVIYYVIIRFHKKYASKLLMIFILPIIFILLKSVFLEKEGNVANLDSSFNLRLDDISAGLKTWLQHIIFGSGLGNNESIVDNMSSWRFIYNSKPGNSAGFSTTLAQGGILWGLLYVLPPIIISRYSYDLLGFALLSFIPFIFVSAQAFYILIMIISYFLFLIIRNDSLYNEKLDKTN